MSWEVPIEKHRNFMFEAVFLISKKTPLLPVSFVFGGSVPNAQETLGSVMTLTLRAIFYLMADYFIQSFRMFSKTLEWLPALNP